MRTLEKTECKVLVRLLELAFEEFSNHGCNDFHLVNDAGLTTEEAEEFISSLRSGEEDFLPNVWQQDFALFSYFRQRFADDAGLRIPEARLLEVVERIAQGHHPDERSDLLKVGRILQKRPDTTWKELCDQAFPGQWSDPETASRLGAAGREILERNRGSLARLMAMIEPLVA